MNQLRSSRNISTDEHINNRRSCMRHTRICQGFMKANRKAGRHSRREVASPEWFKKLLQISQVHNQHNISPTLLYHTSRARLRHSNDCTPPNSVALVRNQTTPTERPLFVGEVRKCQLLRIEVFAWSAQRIPTTVNLVFLDPEPLLLHSSSSSIILTRLSGPRSRPTTS
jgi:hypothetical protein